MTKTLDVLRSKINELDHELLKILSKRMEIVKAIGALKEINGAPVLDEKRREELLQSIVDKAEGLKLSKEFIKKLYALIHDHAVELQKKVKS